jgi:hypothetical protein
MSLIRPVEVEAGSGAVMALRSLIIITKSTSLSPSLGLAREPGALA